MVSSLFGKSSRTNKKDVPVTSLRVQTSIQGKAVPFGYGQLRFAGNLIWAANFTFVFQASPSSGGGKGGGGGSGGKGQSSGAWNYYVTFALSLAEGPIDSIRATYFTQGGLATSIFGTNGALFKGDYAQLPWSSGGGNLAYRGDAYIAWLNLPLGTSPTLQNATFEVRFATNTDIPALGPDANPKDIIIDFLTNISYGVPNFPPALIAPLTQFQAWCRANSFMMSTIVADQSDAASILKGWVDALGCAFRWSSGLLDIIPYGDTSVIGNGFTFNPNITPVYALGPSNFIKVNGSLGSGGGNLGDTSILIARKARNQMLNAIKVEYLDRTNAYNPAIIEIKDEAQMTALARYRPSDVRQSHFFCLAQAAQNSAALQLAREQVAVQYQFTISAAFILLDPMDIVTLTEPNLGLVATPCRVIEIQENDDLTLTITAEEFLGTVSAPVYPYQPSLSSAFNYNADPGSVNPPFVFEPPDQLGGGLAVWGAISGINQSIWGGCYVWVSSDGNTYVNVGIVNGPARMGVLTAALASMANAPLGAATIDTTHTLAVDLTESGGVLISGSSVDLAALNTICVVDSEFLAYQTATFVSTNKYNVTTLSRGAYGTPIAAHAIGAQFARLDAGIFRFPYTSDRIGKPIFIKFQSFNIFQGGLQNLSVCTAYPYTIVGSALTSPLPPITNLRLTYVDAVLNITWDEITDFRTVFYEIRKGSSFSAGLFVTTVAHPPFAVHGNDTYWVSPVAQPAVGGKVYSAFPVSIVIGPTTAGQGANLTSNILSSIDEVSTGLTGTVSGSATLQGGNTFIQGGIVLGTPNTLVDGFYEIPVGHDVDAKRPVGAALGITWTGAGVAIGANILTIADILAQADILGAGSSINVQVFAEVAVAPTSPAVYGPWQKYAPGVYYGRFFKARLHLISNDINTYAIATALKFTVQLPTRIDMFNGVSIGVGGTAIVFAPVDGSGAAPFNGGPNAAGTMTLGNVPHVHVTIASGATGVVPIITALTLSGCTIAMSDNLAHTVNISVTGF